jgi:cell division protein FtsL
MEKYSNMLLIILYFMMVYFILFCSTIQKEISKINSDNVNIKQRIESYEQRISDLESFIDDDSVYE